MSERLREQEEAVLAMVAAEAAHDWAAVEAGFSDAEDTTYEIAGLGVRIVGRDAIIGYYRAAQDGPYRAVDGPRITSATHVEGASWLELTTDIVVTDADGVPADELHRLEMAVRLTFGDDDPARVRSLRLYVKPPD